MKYHFRISLILFLVLLLSATRLTGQKIEYIKVPELEKILLNPDNKLFVVNFWATWCPPCIKELPHFEKVSKENDPAKVEFLLISLDFPSEIDKQLVPFLKKNRINLQVVVMNDLDYNSWINKVDPTWNGNIPATLFFNNSKRTKYFHSGEVDEAELRKYIKSFL